MTDQLWITGDPDADALLSDDAFALLVGMLLDQQYPMEHAFAGPRKIRDRLGSIDPRTVADTDPDAFVTLATTPPAIHRYGRSMAGRIQQLAATIVEDYDGRPANIWETADSAKELLRRLKALPGFGDQKARIFAALLGKQLGVTPDGWREVIGPYAEEGATRSAADIVDPASLQAVRDFKQAAKAKAKAGS